MERENLVMHQWKSRGAGVEMKKRGTSQLTRGRFQVVEKLLMRNDLQTIQGRGRKQELNLLHV